MFSKPKYESRKVHKGNWLTGYRIVEQKRTSVKAKAGFNVVGDWKDSKPVKKKKAKFNILPPARKPARRRTNRSRSRRKSFF